MLLAGRIVVAVAQWLVVAIVVPESVVYCRSLLHPWVWVALTAGLLALQVLLRSAGFLLMTALACGLQALVLVGELPARDHCNPGASWVRDLDHPHYWTAGLACFGLAAAAFFASRRQEKRAQMALGD